MLFVSVYLTLSFHLIAVPLFSCCVFISPCFAFIRSPRPALSSCLSCIPLLIGQPSLPFHAQRLLCCCLLFASSVSTYACVFVSCLFYRFVYFSSVSLPEDDVLCWLLLCLLISSVCFLCFYLRTSWFYLVWSRLLCDPGWIRSGSIYLR